LKQNYINTKKACGGKDVDPAFGDWSDLEKLAPNYFSGYESIWILLV